MALKGDRLANRYGLLSADYADHGGGFPIAVRGIGVIGIVIISGLAQQDDHVAIVGVLCSVLGWDERSMQLAECRSSAHAMMRNRQRERRSHAHPYHISGLQTDSVAVIATSTLLYGLAWRSPSFRHSDGCAHQWLIEVGSLAKVTAMLRVVREQRRASEA
jgi:hypothetical protein